MLEPNVKPAGGGLYDEREVGRIGVVVGGTSGLFIGIGTRKRISELTGAVVHISFFVGSILDFNLSGFCLGFLLSQNLTDKRAVAEVFQTMTLSAAGLI